MKIKLFLAFLTLSVSLCAQINTGGSGGGGGTVTTVNGTANQITSDSASPVTTLSIPSTFIAPGTIAATTTVNGPTGILCGASGTSCVITGTGATSGTSIITWPAIAGTRTNPITFQNNIGAADGTFSLPGISFASQLGTGIWTSGGDLGFSRQGGNTLSLISGGPAIPSSAALIFRNGSFASTNGLSYVADGVIGVGTGAAASVAGSIQAAKFLSGTNCAAVGTAASPSVVSCTAAAAGAFSCATNASAATCTVNTTAVTANSEIFIEEVADEGTRLSVTCNTAPTGIPAIVVASKSAGVSFTINVPTLVTNPACYNYYIVN